MNERSDYLDWLIKRRDERAEWLDNYRYHYNRRRTSDEPSPEFFQVRSEWKAYKELIRRHRQNKWRKRKMAG